MNKAVVTVPKDYLADLERRLAIAEWFIYTYDAAQLRVDDSQGNGGE